MNGIDEFVNRVDLNDRCAIDSADSLPAPAAAKRSSGGRSRPTIPRSLADCSMPSWVDSTCSPRYSLPSCPAWPTLSSWAKPSLRRWLAARHVPDGVRRESRGRRHPCPGRFPARPSFARFGQPRGAEGLDQVRYRDARRTRARSCAQGQVLVTVAPIAAHVHRRAEAHHSAAWNARNIRHIHANPPRAADQDQRRSHLRSFRRAALYRRAGSPRIALALPPDARSGPRDRSDRSDRPCRLTKRAYGHRRVTGIAWRDREGPVDARCRACGSSG